MGTGPWAFFKATEELKETGSGRTHSNQPQSRTFCRIPQPLLDGLKLSQEMGMDFHFCGVCVREHVGFLPRRSHGIPRKNNKLNEAKCQ